MHVVVVSSARLATRTTHSEISTIPAIFSLLYATSILSSIVSMLLLFPGRRLTDITGLATTQNYGSIPPYTEHDPDTQTEETVLIFHLRTSRSNFRRGLLRTVP